MNTTLENTEDQEAEKLAKKIAIIKAHFEKKAEEARVFLKANPIPEKFLKKQG